MPVGRRGLGDIPIRTSRINHFAPSFAGHIQSRYRSDSDTRLTEYNNRTSTLLGRGNAGVVPVAWMPVVSHNLPVREEEFKLGDRYGFQ